MSVSGILSSSLYDVSYLTSVSSNKQNFRQEFQQLGQDLQAGNLSAAQSDFATLQQLGPQTSTAATASSSSNPIQQAFNQLSQDLQSGNLTAAQQDYSNIQQAFQNQSSQSQSQVHPHHHHHMSGGEGSQISQLFQQLGQALQSGNLSTAQQAYNSLSQDLQQLGAGSSSASSPASNSVSVTA